MIDRSVLPQMGDSDPRGVNPQLVRNVRAALDAEGFPDVRITASGGFDPEKIRRLSLFAGRFDFTGDIVMVEGSPLAKQGRRYQPNPRLELVD